MQRWSRRAVALGAGAIPALAFPEPALWWLAWVALVPWVLVVRAASTGREAAIRSWVAAVGFLLATHHWLVSYLSVFALPVFAVFALLWLPWGWLVWRLTGPPRPHSPRWVTLVAQRGTNDPTQGGAQRSSSQSLAALVVLPSTWVVIELVRSWHPLGGPWALLGETQWNHPPTLSPAALGGVWLVSWLVVAVNAVAAVLTRSVTVPVRAAAAGCALAALALGPTWHAVRDPAASTGETRLALVQSGLGDDRADRFEQAVQATQERANDDVELVVWGESSVGFDLDRREDIRARLAGLAAEVGADLLVNVDARRRDDRIYKSAVLVTSDGIAGRYDKTRLVPFGEYIPLRFLLGWIASVTSAAAEDRGRGHEPVVLDGADAEVGPLVSFELAFPDLARRLARRDAELIAAQSMTSSFQSTWAPEQHASRAAVRAMETGRPVVNVGLTGVSAAFDGRGEELVWLGSEERGAVVVTVPLSRERTPYDRLGNWVLIASSLAVLACLALLATSGDRLGRLRSRERD